MLRLNVGQCNCDKPVIISVSVCGDSAPTVWVRCGNEHFAISLIVGVL